MYMYMYAISFYTYLESVYKLSRIDFLKQCLCWYIPTMSYVRTLYTVTAFQSERNYSNEAHECNQCVFALVFLCGGLIRPELAICNW